MGLGCDFVFGGDFNLDLALIGGGESNLTPKDWYGLESLSLLGESDGLERLVRFLWCLKVETRSLLFGSFLAGLFLIISSGGGGFKFLTFINLPGY